MLVLLNWQMLGAATGMVAAINIMIQLSKNKLGKLFPLVSTRVWVFLLAGIILLVLRFFTGSLHGLGDLVHALVNAFVLSLAAMGSYDLFLDPDASKPGRSRSRRY